MNYKACLRRLKDEFYPEDLQAVEELIASYAEQTDEQTAAAQASRDFLSQLLGERKTLGERIAEQGGRLPRRSEFNPPPREPQTEEVTESDLPQKQIIALNAALRRRIPDDQERQRVINLMVDEERQTKAEKEAVDHLRTVLAEDVSAIVAQMEAYNLTSEEVGQVETTPEQDELVPDYAAMEGLDNADFSRDEAIASSNLVRDSQSIPAALTDEERKAVRELTRERKETKNLDEQEEIDAQIKRLKFKPRDEETFIRDALKASTDEAQSKRFGLKRTLKNNPAGQKEIDDSILVLTNEDGKRVPFWAPTLTFAGLDLLRTRGVATEANLDQFRLQAFLTMAGELVNAGYRLPENFMSHIADVTIFSTRNITKDTGEKQTARDLIVAELNALARSARESDQEQLEELRDKFMKATPNSPEERKLGREISRILFARDREAGYKTDAFAQDPDIIAARPEEKLHPAFVVTGGGDTRQRTTGVIARAGDRTGEGGLQYNPHSPDSSEREDSFVYENDRKTDASGASLRQLDQEREQTQRKEPLKPKPTASVVSDDADSGVRAKHRAQNGLREIPPVLGFGKVTKRDVNFVRGILNEIGLTNIGMTVADVESLDTLLEAGQISAQEHRTLRSHFKEPAIKAQFIPRGQSGVIVIRNAGGKTAQRDRLAWLGHEVGHAVYNSIRDRIENPQTDRDKLLARKLKEEYEKVVLEPAYTTDFGFREWFADKISARAKRQITHGNKSLVDKFFRDSAMLLRRTFNAAKSRIAQRFHRNTKFEDVIDAYKEDNVFANIRTIRGDGRIESMIQPQEAIRKYMTAEQLRVLMNNMKKMDLRKMPLLAALFDVDNQLRGMGLDDIANTMYQPTNSTNTQAYWAQVEVQFAHWLGLIQSQFTGKEKKGVIDQVFFQLAQELPDDQLSNKAKAIRKIIKDFHTYLAEVIPNIGELENYFPRDYDLNAIAARADEFTAILRRHGFNAREAMNVFENLTAVRSIAEPNMFVPKLSHLHKHRELNNRELISELVNEGFLNTDPYSALINYVRKSVRRAELERQYGGYKYLDGWTLSDTRKWDSMTSEQRSEALKQNREILFSYLMNHGFIDSPDTTPDQAFERAKAEGHVVGTMETPLWRDPMVGLETMLRDAVVKERITEKQAAHAKKLMMHGLDANDPLDPDGVLYNVTGEIRAFESLRTLLFSGVASIPEVGAVFARNKGTLNIGEFARVVNNTIRNRRELLALAEGIGAIQRDVSDAILTEMRLESDRGKYRVFRRAIPFMFRMNGNNAVVTFSRLIAVSVGKQFILHNAHTVENTEADSIEHLRAKRYLRELGITDHNMVLTWERISAGQRGNFLIADEGTGFSAEARMMKDAINQFVNESVIRPNAAERPSWADHPLGGLVFHLKTFAYSYSKNIIGGMYREGKARYKEDPSFARMLPYYLAAVGIFIALGALGDELRNRIKSLGEHGTWSASYRDPERMVTKWFDRAGFTSLPFKDAIPIPYVQDVGASDVAFALGPTASHLYELFGDGDGITKSEALRSIPIISQWTALRRGLY